MHTITALDAGGSTIDVRLLQLEESERLEHLTAEEALFVVVKGVVDVTLDGEECGAVGGRASVFEGPGDAVYVPPRVQLLMDARTQVEVAVAAAPLAELPAGRARIIRAAEQDVAVRGEGNSARTVRTILGPDQDAGRLLVGETVNPPGNWSSYPPHKHDKHDPPREVQLEEAYLFKTDPPEGFGIQMLYDEHSERAFAVHNNGVAAIASGYHPVVAAPGYSLYYLWVMAGEGRRMIPSLDPKHAWIQHGK